MPLVAELELPPSDRDFATGLMVELIEALRGVKLGALVALTTRADVGDALGRWASLTGHSVVESTTTDDGFRYVVRKGAAPQRDEPHAIGSRLWLYTNFHCNLACDYCCVRSSPDAPRRELGLERIRAIALEARALAIGELFVTGGEPFLLDDIGEILGACTAAAPTTVLTNGMLFAGRRREALANCPRDRLTVQISLDSATPDAHDRRRGDGTWAKAWRGIEAARAMGFRVRLAATVAGQAEEQAIHGYFDQHAIAPEDRVVRRVALRGFAGDGVALGRGDLAPEPTITERGVYWHPVGATDDDFFVTPDALPLAKALDAVRLAYEAQRTFENSLANVFVCG